LSKITSAILVLGAFAAGCGDDDDGGGNNMDGGQPMLDGTVPTGDGATPGGSYTGRVVNSTSLEAVPGRTVRLFNPTDLSFYPGEQVGGTVTFPSRPENAGVFVLGGGQFQDTWSFPPSRIGEEDLIRVGTAATATGVPMIAQYTAKQEAAPLAGTVLWRNKALNRDEAVGCATIEGEGVEDVRFFSGELPASLTSRGLAQGTKKPVGANPANPDNPGEAGRYFIGNVAAGPRTIIVKVAGVEVGRANFLIRPRSSGSELPAPVGKTLLVLGNIMVGENATANPTPATCN
jgi:hypothetical protein